MRAGVTDWTASPRARSGTQAGGAAHHLAEAQQGVALERFIRGPEDDAAEGKGAKKESAASASGLPRRKAGKLVFGGAAGGVGRESRAAEKAKAPEKKEEKKEEKNKFTAFQGSGNKLK